MKNAFGKIFATAAAIAIVLLAAFLPAEIKTARALSDKADEIASERIFGDQKSCLTVCYSGRTTTYNDEEIAAPDHEAEYEIHENKINSGHREKAALVKQRVKRGLSKKCALVASYPLLPAFFEKISREIERLPKDSKITFSPGGQPKFIITREKNGIKADERAFYSDVFAAWQRSSTAVITLRTEQIPPAVTAADNKKQTFLKARFCTDYSRSGKNRKHNVELAMQKTDGTELSDGESFSFNKTVGRRSGENGFYEAKIIVGGEYVDGLGGGVCQASTTLYNAALLAGMNVDEAGSHTLAPSYVAPSFDAAVSYGSRDLKFTNCSGGRVFIHTYCSGGKAIAEFYGVENKYHIVRKSVVVSQGEAPEDKIIMDEEGKYFAPDAEEGSMMRIRGGSASLVSEGYLLYYESGKCVKTRKIRSDKYMPVRGILVKKP